MHPTVLFFVLLFLPNTNLRDWQHADAPNLHKLMSEGALGLMNARTAEYGAITTEGGENTIFAGVPATSNEVSPGSYSAVIDNLVDGLTAAGVGTMGDLPINQVQAPFYIPDIPAEFVSTHLTGSMALIDNQISTYADIVRQRHGVLMIVSPNPTVGEFNAQQKLTPALLWGEKVPKGYLQSASTRTVGLITNLDIAPFIAQTLGARLPIKTKGSVISVSRSNDDILSVLLKREDSWITQEQVLRFVPFIVGLLSLLVAVAIWLYPGNPKLAAAITAAVTMAPLVMLFSPSIAICIGLTIFALLIALKALLPDDTAPFSALAILLYLLIDSFFFSGRLSAGSMLGYSPIEGQFYYGIGTAVLGAYIGVLAVMTGLWDWKGEHQHPLIALWILAAISLAFPFTGERPGGFVICATCLASYWVVGAGWKLQQLKTIAVIIGVFVVAVLAAVATQGFGLHTSVIAHPTGLSLMTALRSASHSYWTWLLAFTTFGRIVLRRNDVLSSVGTVATIGCLFVSDAGIVAAAICGLTVWAAEFNRYVRAPVTPKLTIVESPN